MQIRTRLTLQFLLLGGFIMIAASLAIYYSSARFRQQDFYDRLGNLSRSVATLILDPYKPDPQLAKIIEQDNPANLYNRRIIIFNHLNDTLYNSDLDSEIRVEEFTLNKIRSEGKVMSRQGKYEVLGTLFTINVQRTSFVVIAAAVDREGTKNLSELRNILVIVCLVSLLAFFAAGWLFSGRALKPISEVIDRVDDISITSLNLRVPEGNGTDEIGRLAKTFNKMLERLETSFGMQKSFIANASHELRTPLTSINGQLEVLTMKERSVDEYKSALTSVMEDIKSLINLSNRLLLIARTSAEGPSGYSKSLRIDEILWVVREEILRFNKEYHINLYMDESLTDSGQIEVKGDEYLLKVAFLNLIENACKYSSDNTVDVRFGYSGRMTEVLFEDRGIGIPEEDLKKIFEPFFRSPNAVSQPGSGIGLSLVNQIVKNHNGSIEIDSKVGIGTRIKVLFPTAS